MTCTIPDCTNYAEGTTQYCATHNKQRRKPVKTKTKRKRIRPVSPKRKKQLELYSTERKKFLQQHPNCQAPNCKNKATEVHHMKLRTNEMLLDKNYWKATCRECHTYYTINSNQAILDGFSVKRNGK